MLFFVKTIALFVVTAIAEIAGCYLAYLWLRQGKTAWLIILSLACLALFAWLLTFHPAAAGRTYAAYGGIYVTMALAWLWWIEGVQPDRWDLVGGAITVSGMLVIAFGRHVA